VTLVAIRLTPVIDTSSEGKSAPTQNLTGVLLAAGNRIENLNSCGEYRL
jgi:hypothetical protein